MCINISYTHIPLRRAIAAKPLLKILHTQFLRAVTQAVFSPTIFYMATRVLKASYPGRLLFKNTVRTITV